MTIINKSYKNNYIQTYLWRSISLLTSILSLGIVIPHISDNKELYGLYAFCLSLNMYLSYADLGFLGAGQKYAAEAFTNGNREEETKIFGFTGFILLLMVIPFSIGLIFLAYHPEYIIKDLSAEGKEIASGLFFITGIFSPIQILLQRLVQSVLIIRIKDYISLRINTIFNLIKIFSVFYFFNSSSYRLVDYYLFINITSLISSIIIMIYIYKIANYNFVALFKSIRFDSEKYEITKRLAFSSLLLNIGWVIYYELDLVIVGNWLGAKEVAIYAIAFTFLNFLRTLWNVVFSPYSQRFNHFSVEGAHEKMQEIAKSIVTYTFPLSIIVTFTLILSVEHIVIMWVGEGYIESIPILQILISTSLFVFINQPAQYYFTSKTKYSYINLMALVLPSLFLISLFLSIQQLGALGVAISKLLAMGAGFGIATYGLNKLVPLYPTIKKRIIPTSLVTLIVYLIHPISIDYIFHKPQKNSLDLVLLIMFDALVILMAYSITLLMDKKCRKMIKSIDLKTLLKMDFLK